MEHRELVEWIEEHRGTLHEISERFGTDERVTRGLAVMVLDGYSDADVYADLGHEILVWDGQRSPLRDVPALLSEIRQLVATT